MDTASYVADTYIKPIYFRLNNNAQCLIHSVSTHARTVSQVQCHLFYKTCCDFSQPEIRISFL